MYYDHNAVKEKIEELLEIIEKIKELNRRTGNRHVFRIRKACFCRRQNGSDFKSLGMAGSGRR